MREELGPFTAIMRLFGLMTTLAIIRKAKGILCISPPVEEMLIRLGFPRRRVFSTSMGVDFDLIQKAKSREKSFEGVFLGRIDRHKGIEDLIHAWEIVAKELPRARLLVIGAGPFLGKAKELVRLARLENIVDFRGYVSGVEKFELLKSARLFVFPSFSEGFGLAVAEAMACGIPVVCFY
jgi:glycosyltransferase involved in cell wall biosynthesis